MHTRPTLAAALALTLLAAAPASQPLTRALATVTPARSAATRPSDQHVAGTVAFTQDGDAVTFVADLDGLTANAEHGFHVHEKADLTDPDLKGAGGHYNPTHQPHGGPDAPHHHVGDLGNLKADAAGHAHLEGRLPGLKLTDLVGRSVIIHAKADDLHSQPAGDSGARIAGGAIVAQ